MSSGPDFLTRKTTEDVEVLTTFDPRLQRAAEAGARRGLRARRSRPARTPRPRSSSCRRTARCGRWSAGATSAAARASSTARPRRSARPGRCSRPSSTPRRCRRAPARSTAVLDAPLTLYVPGSGDWSPQNYTPRVPRRDHARRGAGAVDQHRDGAGRRRRPGAPGCAAVAQDFGLTGPIADGPAMALGVSEATLLEMTGAYAGILNRGRQRRGPTACGRCAARRTARR